MTHCCSSGKGRANWVIGFARPVTHDHEVNRPLVVSRTRAHSLQTVVNHKKFAHTAQQLDVVYFSADVA
jgi:hypothetical protein